MFSQLCFKKNYGSKCRYLFELATRIYLISESNCFIKTSFQIVFPGSFETYINPRQWEGYAKSKHDESKDHGWGSDFRSFHKLILIKCCKEEKVGGHF